ncbi:hypothetical protein CDAR_51371 [Caerostris darwini]|uniref:Uncharacterized protein n=1 Tax=Caerostris darwini TaxID=1538125 RepID=A0AAV4U676_9ARAC|nr:hypothetical protein CDAR_51371 [Caerostris darwini]
MRRGFKISKSATASFEQGGLVKIEIGVILVHVGRRPAAFSEIIRILEDGTSLRTTDKGVYGGPFCKGRTNEMGNLSLNVLFKIMGTKDIQNGFLMGTLL